MNYNWSQETLNVLHIVSYFHPAVRAGGPAFASFSLTRGLARQGIGVTVYTTNLDLGQEMPVPANEPVEAGGVTIYYHPVRGLRGYLFSPDLWRRLRREIHSFDLVHLHETWTFPILAGAFWCWRRDIPYVTSPRGSLDTWCVQQRFAKKKLYFRLLAKRIYEHAALVHFTAAPERDNLSPMIPFTLGPSVVIPNPLDLEEYESLPPPGQFRKRLGLAADQPIVLFVGRLHPKKGLDLIFRAFQGLQHPRAVLAIVGPYEEGYRGRLEGLAAELEIASRVIFTGALTGADKLAAYRDSLVLALPSQQENFGMVVAEAMAAGLPVLISEFVNIANEVAKVSAGLVLPLELSPWTEAMDRLLENHETGCRMGRAGREFVIKNYSTERVTERMLEIYKKLLSCSL